MPISYFQAIVLGLLQGVSELFPVSSLGHSVLIPHWIGGSWATVVGADIAGHSRPVSLVDGELTVEAESTAWATQLRLLNKTILTRIGSVVGHNLVIKLRIHGPAAPARAKGQWRVRGSREPT